ncbi:MAG TPA: efflux RND transporter periplasmic adaptor subunit [Thermoanaerobaculia bacterium]|jgi:cobalt-zinc-cadmium efflux system membrane fusion protein|nr:efflux RND transporter periplasmic adaptor subunit [Thermoanaerobaculia bacterium]
MREQNRTAALAALALASILAAGCGHPSAKAPEPEKAEKAETPAGQKPAEITLPAAQRQKIRLEQVALAPFRRTIETTGTVAFDQNRTTQVLAPISGPVARLQVELGARVARGQALATVASPDFAADVSALRKAEALARNARRLATLDEQLWKNDAIARRDMEQAETDAVGAEADRDSALQQLRALGVDDTTIKDIRENRPISGSEAAAAIRSPVSGTVVEKLISPGQLLQAGTTPCFTVADLSSVWVMANLFESDLPFVAPGAPAQILTEGGHSPIQGKVDYIAAIVDPTTRAVAVRIVAPNPNGMLKRDLYVRAIIQASRDSDGLLVPVSAVLRDDENLPFVFVAGPQGSFGRRRVTLGSRTGDRQEVTSGLTAGETIVVEGALFLQFAENQ